MLNVVLMAAALAAPPSPAPSPAAAPVLRIYLARHGQTAWNAERRLQGGKDIPLNDTGRQHAKDLAARLDGVALDQIYSSALSRARQTADALSGRAPREALPGLNEQSIGAFEGVYADGKEPERYAEFQKRSANAEDALDGGESKGQFFARVRSTVEAIRRRHPAGGQVLIVAHGGTNQQVLRALLDLSEADTNAIQQANDELYVVELREGRRPLVWKLIPPDRLKEL
jgi:2,3-bisphosphoglycerate-dependent phosphoglycerate mutase